MRESIFARQKALLSPEAQARLRAATVFVAGIGGLGGFVAEGLTRFGIGGLVLVDPDRVSPSDLNRQILYTAKDVGAFKAQVAKERLLAIRDDLWVEAWVQPVSERTVIPSQTKVVVDALDNWESRFVLDELARKAGKYLVHAGLSGFFGQVTTISPDATSRLKDIFSGAREEEIPSAVFSICAVLAALQVQEVVNIICGRGPRLAGRLLVVDLEHYGFEMVPLVK